MPVVTNEPFGFSRLQSFSWYSSNLHHYQILYHGKKNWCWSIRNKLSWSYFLLYRSALPCVVFLETNTFGSNKCVTCTSFQIKLAKTIFKIFISWIVCIHVCSLQSSSLLPLLVHRYISWPITTNCLLAEQCENRQEFILQRPHICASLSKTKQGPTSKNINP